MSPAKIIRSNRRSICLEITPEAVLIIRAPHRVPESYLEKLIQEKAGWIQKKITAVKNRPKPLSESPVDAKTLASYKQKAKEIIFERVARYARQMGVVFVSVKISSARKRWGSCSRGNNLNFSWRLICHSLEIIDYVIIHELAHIVHKHHRQTFWQLVAAHCPDFKIRKKQLQEFPVSPLFTPRRY